MSFIPLQSVQRARANVQTWEKAGRLPPWFKVKIQKGGNYRDIRKILDEQGLHTICEEAKCPNVWECWNNRTATFLILGDICTRRCGYCSVTTGRPEELNQEEPQRVAHAVNTLGLRHAVITSVNRDELEDGGASMFAKTIRAIRELSPSCSIEVLIPDFQGNEEALGVVLKESPDILNHNIETVPRLFPTVRPQGKYLRSLELLKRAKQLGGRTKSGIIAGMGETPSEMTEVMTDLRKAECDILSIGQYLQPTKAHIPVSRYYTPEEFDDWGQEAKNLGFDHVESGPLVRSSYHAEQQTKVGTSGSVAKSSKY